VTDSARSNWLDADPPDLVVLDLGLPVVSGLMVREELAAQVHTRNIPIVVVTASRGPHEELDVACVLYKPVTTEQLIETIRGCLATAPPAVT
jgi:CheY-like chemotaxis protein